MSLRGGLYIQPFIGPNSDVLTYQNGEAVKPSGCVTSEDALVSGTA